MKYADAYEVADAMKFAAANGGYISLLHDCVCFQLMIYYFKNKFYTVTEHLCERKISVCLEETRTRKKCVSIFPSIR